MSYAGVTQERQMILLVCSLDCHYCSLLNLIHTSTSTVRSSSTYLGLLVQPYHEPQSVLILFLRRSNDTSAHLRVNWHDSIIRVPISRPPDANCRFHACLPVPLSRPSWGRYVLSAKPWLAPPESPQQKQRRSGFAKPGGSTFASILSDTVGLPYSVG